MKRETHETNIRQRVTKAARRLFFQQGYGQTGIRQIGEAADVKTGTIYHFFNNKEGIMQQVAMEAFHRVIERSRRLSGDNEFLETAIEIAWHVYTMIHHHPSAEMYVLTYNAPAIAAEILDSQIARTKAIFAKRKPEFTDQHYQVFNMFTKGAMQSISLKAFDNTLENPAFVIQETITHILRLMDVEKADIELTLEQLEALKIEQRVLRVLERDVVPQG